MITLGYIFSITDGEEQGKQIQKIETPTLSTLYILDFI